MSKRSQRRGRKGLKSLSKRSGACNKKTKQFSIAKKCEYKTGRSKCGVIRYVMPSDAHHVKYCLEHRDVAERDRRKMAMRKRRAKLRRTSTKRTTRKAA